MSCHVPFSKVLGQSGPGICDIAYIYTSYTDSPFWTNRPATRCPPLPSFTSSGSITEAPLGAAHAVDSYGLSSPSSLSSRSSQELYMPPRDPTHFPSLGRDFLWDGGRRLRRGAKSCVVFISDVLGVRGWCNLRRI